jgi:hypothetical protein
MASVNASKGIALCCPFLPLFAIESLQKSLQSRSRRFFTPYDRNPSPGLALGKRQNEFLFSASERNYFSPSTKCSSCSIWTRL